MELLIALAKGMLVTVLILSPIYALVFSFKSHERKQKLFDDEHKRFCEDNDIDHGMK